MPRPRIITYLRAWKSHESLIEYARFVALVAAKIGVYPQVDDDLTVNEAMVRYIRFVGGHGWWETE